MSVSIDYTPNFLKVVVHRNEKLPDMYGLHVPFENKVWMAETFVELLFEYLPEFTLRYTEFQNINGANAIAKLRDAARSVYQTKKFENRGEFGELMLHTILRELHHTVPAVSKIFYKDSGNDTVKGFDAVHVVDTDDELELWLGEVKFYKDAKQAARDVIKELADHFKTNFLRNEFMFITNKIDDAWPHADTLKKMISSKTSLDDIFSRIKIPVLITYDSDVLNASNSYTEAFVASITTEFDAIHDYFIDKLGGFEYEIHLYLLPMKSKEELIKLMDNRLMVWKMI